MTYDAILWDMDGTLVDSEPLHESSLTDALLRVGIKPPAGLHAATLGGARALGMDAQTGSIREGKLADLIAIDLSGPSTQPVYNVVSQLVYACTGAEVTHSWIEGQCLLRERRLVTLDLADTLARARAWGEKIAGHTS